jgi:LuxR family transcriptional regulator, maltose regulon positive regulatory protein
MKQPLPPLAKISRPRSQDVFLRKRLFSLLDRKRKQPVIWVCGPAGSGKTTLVNSYIEARNLHALWYQVDSGDGDPATFFHYLGLAAKKAAPRKRSPLPHLTPEYLMGIPTFTRRFFENLYGRLKIPYLVVFDNYHEVQGDSLFHEVLHNGLETAPEGINVIIISRSEPPPVFERMLANQLMNVISWDDLRLNLDEFKGIIRYKGFKKMSNDMIRQLHSSTEGWAAGLLLVLEKSKTEDITAHTLDKHNPELLFDYFASEIFQKIDKETQDVLTKMALLPFITHAMVKRLTGIHHGDRILSDLNKHNFFIERKQSERQIVYQYHAMFREFLLSRAKELFTPKQLLKLKQKAAMILEESDNIEDAAVLFIELNDWNSLAHLINENAEQLTSNGRAQTVLEWLNAFPSEILDNTPWLSYWFGMCCLNLKPSDSVSHFEKAFESFKEENDTKGMLLAISGVLRGIVNEFKVFKRLDAWIDIIDELKLNLSVKKYPEIQDYVTTSVFMALGFRRPDHPEFNMWKKRLCKIVDEGADLNLRTESSYFLIFHYLESGDFANALIVLNSIREIAKLSEISPAILILGKLAEVAYYFHNALHDQCSKALKCGLNIVKKSGLCVWESHLLGASAANLISMGDLDEAEKYLNQMSSVIKADSFKGSYYHMLKGWYSLLRNDLPLARKHMEKSYLLDLDVGALFPLSVSNFGMAQVLYECGEREKAYSHLSEVEHIGRRMKSSYINFTYLLVKAQFAFDRDDDRNGFKYLQRAMSLGRENGLFNFFLCLPDVMVKLCMKALTEGIEVDYVKMLIRKRNLFPENPPLDIENWPWPLRIHTLGRFEIVKDEKLVQFSRKAPRKPLAMLKVSIAFGGNEVSETRISDALWPEADGDAAHHAFTTNLSRLRQLTGIEKAITLQEGRLSIDPRYCWIDIWAFERLFDQAEEAAGGGRNDKCGQIIEEAIGMYRGNFLAGDIEEPWAISTRERLRSKFIKCLSKLGSHWEEAGEFEKAIDCYNKGLEVYDLAEEFYQKLMICYHRIGRDAEAIGVYKRLKKILSSTTGINPSPKTEQIFKSLKS